MYEFGVCFLDVLVWFKLEELGYRGVRVIPVHWGPFSNRLAFLRSLGAGVKSIEGKKSFSDLRPSSVLNINSVFLLEYVEAGLELNEL